MVTEQRVRREVWLEAGVVGTVSFLLNCALILFVYQSGIASIEDQTSQGLLRSAKVMASIVDGDRYGRLAKEGQPGEAEVVELSAALRAAKLRAGDVVYLYSLALRDEKIVFISDANIPSDGTTVETGEVYEDAPEEMWRALREGVESVSDSPYTDRWGTFFSAVVPIKNSAGVTVGAISMDLDATDFIGRQTLLRKRVAGALGFNAGLAVLLSAGWWVLGRKREKGPRLLR